MGVAGQTVEQGNCQQCHGCHRPHGAHPAYPLNQFANDGRKDKLPKRATGIDDARCRTARCRWHALCRSTQQNREATSTRAHGSQYTHGENEAHLAVYKRGDGCAHHQNEQAIQQDRPRTVFVGKGAGNGLNRPPHKLTDGHGQTDAHNAQAGVGI